jgi:hypothetical protein
MNAGDPERPRDLGAPEMGDGEMPKEKLQDESGILAQVVWSHDQYVQIATLSTNPKDFVLWCRNIVEQYDAHEAAQAKGKDSYFADESLGMFWSPNRYQINDLIRHLRRARDQAFGRDE